MKRIIALISALFCFPSFGQTINPAQINDKTITFTAAVSGSIPTPVQAASSGGYSQQYIVTNTGSVLAFISYAATSSVATTNCVVPTGGSPTNTIPVLPSSAIIVTLIPNAYFCGITNSSTAVIYVTPAVGI